MRIFVFPCVSTPKNRFIGLRMLEVAAFNWEVGTKNDLNGPWSSLKNGL